jgi:hypothetical protein
MIFAGLDRKPRGIRNVDYPEEKHNGEHWAGRRNSEVLGVWHDRQDENKQGDRGGYDPQGTVFSAPAHHSLTIRDQTDIGTVAKYSSYHRSSF